MVARTSTVVRPVRLACFISTTRRRPAGHTSPGGIRRCDYRAIKGLDASETLSTIGKFQNVLPRPSTHRLTNIVVEQSFKCASERIDVRGRHQDAVPPLKNDFGGPGPRAGNDGKPARHRLEVHEAWATLVHRGGRKDV